MATINLGRIKPVFRGAYNASTAYVVDDIVTDSNETFICILASTNNATSNATYWTKLAAKGTDGTDLTSTLTTQGDVLYRDSSGLARLAAGTSGQFLKTQGAGANPVWAGSGLAMQSVVTASTLTAVAGRAYPINTTSNACTITLPASASVGDEIKFIDYIRTWGTNAITLDQQSLNYQGGSDVSPVYNTSGQAVTIVYVDATQGWIPTVDDDVTYETERVIRYMVLAGGGGAGSDNGGGGGGGGMRGGNDDDDGKFIPTASTTYTAVVGAGGSSGSPQGSKGSNSSLAGSGLTTITATGGGIGGDSSGADAPGDPGGCGGAGTQGGSGGSGNEGSYTPVEGYDGGGSTVTASGGAGGGGTAAAGDEVTVGTGQGSVGHGGLPKASDITGTSIKYGGGGGGGGNQTSQTFVGNGGGSSESNGHVDKGGATDGGGYGSAAHAAQYANLGGGAGGGGQGNDGTGRAGGSGVVIVRMSDTVYASSTGTVTVDTSSFADETILKFTGNGTFTTAAF